MADYFKWKDFNGPVLVKVLGYGGKVEKEYQGKISLQHEFDLEINQRHLIFQTTSDKAADNLNSAMGRTVMLEKVSQNNKTFINVYDPPKNAPQPTKQALKSAPAPQPTKYVSEDDKQYETNLGKCRHGFAVEAFKMKMPLNDETMKLITKWAEFSMNGKMAEAKKETPAPELAPMDDLPF